VICGARDYFYSPEIFAETAHRIPHGKLIMYPKLGHNIVTSKQFVADVISFLGMTAPLPRASDLRGRRRI
jgi:hypothetical protein